MNEKLKTEIIGYLSALFNQIRSQGIEQIDLIKVVDYINDKFRIQLDPKNMEEILNQIGIVSDINDMTITIAGKEEETDDEEVSDDVEEKAADEAYDNLTSESFVGKELDIKKIKLDESMKDYFILKGAQNNSVNLICCNYDSKNGFLKCRLKGKNIFVDVERKVL